MNLLGKEWRLFVPSNDDKKYRNVSKYPLKAVSYIEICTIQFTVFPIDIIEKKFNRPRPRWIRQ